MSIFSDFYAVFTSMICVKSEARRFASLPSQIYADTVAGKQVGYTPSEAKQKSLEAAAALAVKRMTE